MVNIDERDESSQSLDDETNDGTAQSAVVSGKLLFYSHNL